MYVWIELSIRNQKETICCLLKNLVEQQSQLLFLQNSFYSNNWATALFPWKKKFDDPIKNLTCKTKISLEKLLKWTSNVRRYHQ